MLKGLKASSEFFIYACGILLFSSVFIITVEVILRKFFSISFGGTDELAGYALGISISWSLAYTLFQKMHIRIDVLYSKMPKIVQNVLDTVSLAFTLMFIGLLTYFSYFVFATSFAKKSISNTPLGAPLWIPQGIWFLGFFFFFLVVLILFLKSIKALISNKSDSYTNIKKEENLDFN